MKVACLILILLLAGCASGKPLAESRVQAATTERLLAARAQFAQMSQSHCDAIQATNQYVNDRQTAYGTTGAMGVGTVENLGHALAARRANASIRQIDEELARRGVGQ